MRIAIIGKGGSGKSSISWLLTNYFYRSNKKVLAVDADYNMDLMHNLDFEFPENKLLKKSEKDIYDVFDLDLNDNAFLIPEKKHEEVFSIFPDDNFTRKYSEDLNDNLKLMVLGDHDNETMYSGRCSHAYAKAVKFYLPYLKLKENEIAIVDSVAGTDMVNYGLFFGVDAVFCVVEDTKNSFAVMESAKKLCEDFSIAFYPVINKYQGGEIKHVNSDVVTKFYFDPALSSYDYDLVSKENLESCNEFESFISNNLKSENRIYRLIDWKNKNSEFLNK